MRGKLGFYGGCRQAFMPPIHHILYENIFHLSFNRYTNLIAKFRIQIRALRARDN